jgi:hypothetical protein
MNASIRLFPLSGASRRSAEVENWMREHDDQLGALARKWFDVIRACGEDVHDLLHDGHPTACVGGVALAYVNAFQAHVNVGFFLGTALADPDGLLEGAGRFMRHVKVQPGKPLDEMVLERLIRAAYLDLKRHLGTDGAGRT